MKERVAEIVAAYLKRNAVAADQIPELITSVYSSLSALGNAPPPAPNALTPALPVRRSVRPDSITCLDCGWKGSMLKRHLMSAHSLSVDDYRTRWSLGADYPMVAPNYAARRSSLAKSAGLGRTGRKRAAP